MNSEWAVVAAAGVGAIVGLAGSLIVAVVDWKKWRKERGIDLMREERQRFENYYGNALREINSWLTSDVVDTIIMTSLLTRCPKEVRDAIMSVLEKRAKEHDFPPENKTNPGILFHDIVLAINTHLAKLDDQIRNAV